jgi:GST-like protein
MYELFGAPRAGSAAIEIALEYCGVDYRVINTEHDQDALLRVNPLGQLPTLVLPDRQVLTESAAILIHLGLAFPASGLLDQVPETRAQQLRSLIYLVTNCYAAIGIIDYPERWLSDDDAALAKQVVAGAKARLYQQWSAFSHTFGTQPGWQPHKPGAPEILASVISRWAGAREHLRAAVPEFHHGLMLIDQHPLVGTVCERHWPS